MTLVRLAARPMLASAYIANGIGRMKSPEGSAESVDAVLRLASKAVDVPIDSVTAARIAGAAQVAAGALLAIGRFPRIASTVLVGTYLLDVVGTQLAQEKAASKEEKRERTNSLLMKTSMLGGALLASVDTAGRPGLAWRAQHAAEDLWRNVEKTSAKAVSAVSPSA